MWWPWKKIIMSNEFRVVVDVYHHFPADQSLMDRILARLGKLEKTVGELEDKLDAADTAGVNLTAALDAEVQRSQDRVNKFNTQIADLQDQITALKALPATPETLARIAALQKVMEDATVRVNALDVTSPEVLP